MRGSNRWATVGVMGYPKLCRQVGFRDKALVFYNSRRNNLYITQEVKDKTVFVDYVIDKDNTSEYLIAGDLSMYRAATVGAIKTPVPFLVYNLRCDVCKGRLIYLAQIKVCQKCENIR